MTNVDLWPAGIGLDSEIKVPTSILKEQAALLAQKTRGLVVAEVRGEADPRDGKFVDNFYLVGPNVSYRYLLFTIRYPIELYPVELFFEPWNETGLPMYNEQDLIDNLKQLFAHQKTGQIIQAIIARSK